MNGNDPKQIQTINDVHSYLVSVNNTVPKDINEFKETLNEKRLSKAYTLINMSDDHSFDGGYDDFTSMMTSPGKTQKKNENLEKETPSKVPQTQTTTGTAVGDSSGKATGFGAGLSRSQTKKLPSKKDKEQQRLQQLALGNVPVQQEETTDIVTTKEKRVDVDKASTKMESPSLLNREPYIAPITPQEIEAWTKPGYAAEYDTESITEERIKKTRADVMSDAVNYLQSSTPTEQPDKKYQSAIEKTFGEDLANIYGDKIYNRMLNDKAFHDKVVSGKQFFEKDKRFGAIYEIYTGDIAAAQRAISVYNENGITDEYVKNFIDHAEMLNTRKQEIDYISNQIEALVQKYEGRDAPKQDIDRYNRLKSQYDGLTSELKDLSRKFDIAYGARLESIGEYIDIQKRVFDTQKEFGRIKEFYPQEYNEVFSQARQTAIDENMTAFEDLTGRFKNEFIGAFAGVLKFPVAIAANLGNSFLFADTDLTYTPLDAVSEGWGALLDRQNAMMSTPDWVKMTGKVGGDFQPFLMTKQEFMDEDGNTNWYGLAQDIAGGAGYMAALVGMGMMGGASLPATASNAMRLGVTTFVPAYTMSYADYRSDAMERGLTNKQASVYAHFTAALEGVTEMIMPETKLVMGSIRKKMLAGYIDDLAKHGIDGIEKRFSKRFWKELASSGVKESAEEWANSLGTFMADIVAASTNPDFQYEVPKINDIVNITASSLVLGSVGGASGARQTVKNSETIMKYDLANNYTDAVAIINQMYEPEQAKKLTEDIRKIQAELGNVPSGLGNVKSAKVAELLADAKYEQSKAEELKDKSPVMAAVHKKKVNEIQKEIEDVISNENFEKEFAEEAWEQYHEGMAAMMGVTEEELDTILEAQEGDQQQKDEFAKIQNSVMNTMRVGVEESKRKKAEQELKENARNLLDTITKSVVEGKDTEPTGIKTETKQEGVQDAKESTQVREEVTETGEEQAEQLGDMQLGTEEKEEQIKEPEEKEEQIKEPEEKEEQIKEPEEIKEVVSDEEYNDFIDNGAVSEERLNSIADKVASREALSERENAVFINKTSEINSLIEQKQEVQDAEKGMQEGQQEDAQPVETKTETEQKEDVLEGEDVAVQQEEQISDTEQPQPTEQPKPTKEEKLKQKAKEADDLMADALSRIASKVGAKKGIAPEGETSIIEDLLDVARAITMKGEIAGEKLFNRVMDAVKGAGHTLDEETQKQFKDKVLAEYPEKEGEAQVEGKEEPTEKPTKKKEKVLGAQDTRGEKKGILVKDKTKEQRIIKEIVEENKGTYNVTSLSQAVEEGEKLINDLGGVSEAYTILKDRSKHEDLYIYQAARMILVGYYAKQLADPNVDNKTDINDRVTELQNRISRDANRAGLANAILKIWSVFTPEGLKYNIHKNIDKINKAIAGKYQTNKENLDEGISQTVEEALKGKREAIEKIAKNEKLMKQIMDAAGVKYAKETKVPKEGRKPTRESIKKEKNYRKQRTEAFKKALKNRGFSSTGNIDVLIEYGADIAASFIREGYYSVKEIADKIKKHFKDEHDLDLNDDRINKIMNHSKSEGGETISDKADKKIKQIKPTTEQTRKEFQEIIESHFSERGDRARTLAQKLMDQFGIDPKSAKSIEAQVTKNILDGVKEKVDKKLGTMLTMSALTSREKKNILNKITDAVKMGALNDSFMRQAFAAKFGFVELTDANTNKINSYVDVITDQSMPEELRIRAATDMSKYLYELYPKGKAKVIIDTWVSMYYSSILSGISTSVINISSAGLNGLMKPIRDFLNLSRWAVNIKDLISGKPMSKFYNPFSNMLLRIGLNGFRIGGKKFAQIMREGSIDNKYNEKVYKQNEITVNQVERNNFGKGKRFKPVNVSFFGQNIDLKIFNLMKYSGRLLSAQDSLMFESAYNMEIALALLEAAKIKGLKGKKAVDFMRRQMFENRADRQVIKNNARNKIAEYEKTTGDEVDRNTVNNIVRDEILKQMELTEEEKMDTEDIARDNIFTYKRNGLFGKSASLMNVISNSTRVGQALLKPHMPFTTILGNLMDYAIDHAPIYGLMRAHGFGVTGIADRMAKLFDKNGGFDTSQLGDYKSKKYYEQMGRAWMGTALFLTTAALFLGTDDDDDIQITGGLHDDPGGGGWKTPRKKLMPAYSIRINKFVFKYSDFPMLMIPLGIIGNANDKLRTMSKQEKDGFPERLAVVMSSDVFIKTMSMSKDLSLLQNLTALGDMMNAISNVREGEDVEQLTRKFLTTYFSAATRPLPQEWNFVNQIEKIFDPKAYTKQEIQDYIKWYLGLTYYVGEDYPLRDVLGEPVKTYPGESTYPYQIWLNDASRNTHHQFLSKFDAYPNSIKPWTPVSKKGLATKEPPTKKEYDQWTEKTGVYFKQAIDKIMEKTSEETLDEMYNTKYTDSYDNKTNGVRELVLKQWYKAKSKAKLEVFGEPLAEEEFYDEYIKEVSTQISNELYNESKGSTGGTPTFKQPKFKGADFNPTFKTPKLN